MFDAIYKGASLESWGVPMGNVFLVGAWFPYQWPWTEGNFTSPKVTWKNQVINTLRLYQTIPQQSTALTKWEITFTGMSSSSYKNSRVGNYSLESFFSSSHFRETKHSCWKESWSCWYWMDAPIKVFESGIRIFMFQTRNRSICYQY